MRIAESARNVQAFPLPGIDDRRTMSNRSNTIESQPTSERERRKVTKNKRQILERKGPSSLWWKRYLG